MEEVIYLERPTLNKPYLVLGFEGWPNAAEVSSFSIHHLITCLSAKRFASIPYESFYDLSSSRPTAVIKEGRLKALKFPANHFYYSRQPSSHDLILLQGVEPHFHWNAFVDLIMDIAEGFDVHQIITLGGTYDYLPHTGAPVVSSVVNHEDLRETVKALGLGLTEYVGPISIHTFILETARKRGLGAISLWGHAPQYLQTKNIKVAYATLTRLVDLTGMRIDLGDLREASRFFDQQVNQLVNQDPKLKEIVEKLEQLLPSVGKLSPGTQGEEEKKEEKENVVYIQAFLKRQEEEEKGES